MTLDKDNIWIWIPSFRQKNPNVDELVPFYTEIYLSHFKVRGKSQKDFLNTLENLAIRDPQPILKPTDWQMVKYKTEMSKIFRKIARKDLTKQGLEELHNFR